MRTRLPVTMSLPHPHLGLGQSQSMRRVVPTNQGQTKVLQEPQSGEPGSPVSTQASASRVHELCCLSMRIFHLSCLSKAVRLMLLCPAFSWLGLLHSLLGPPLLRETERGWDGLTGECGFSSKVGSSLLALLTLGLHVSNSYFHVFWGPLSLVHQGAWSTPSRSYITQEG